MTILVKEDFQATLENENIMDFSDTQDIDNTCNILSD